MKKLICLMLALLLVLSGCAAQKKRDEIDRDRAEDDGLRADCCTDCRTD